MPKKEIPSRRAQTFSAHELDRHFVEPMKCLPVKHVPEGDDWLYELKFDGYRSLAICRGGQALLLSRNRKEFNVRFPALVAALQKLRVKEAIFDGEIVALDENHRPSFQVLQNYEDGPLAYYIFDLLSLNGDDWTGRPLVERKERLLRFFKGIKPPLFYSADLTGDPSEIWKDIVAQRWEGLIAKQRQSLYEPGRRTGKWVKVKAILQQEFVIGGYTRPQGSRSGFGALLVGVHMEGGLRFCAKVGTGFNEKLLQSLLVKMEKLKVEKCPFFNLPVPRSNRWGGGVTASEMRLCTWIKPKLVGEVQFTEWTGDYSLRHPAFLGLRDDLSARDVRREEPADRA